ncbi:MAG: hypothetical protein HYX69_16070 [Planctomycetia bacterium]|nr:hypothetical protein [Planctomycetia bacterium]
MSPALILTLSLLQPGALHAEFVALFTPLEYRYTGGGYRDHLFRYRLFVPDGADAARPLPLLVWLHGYGESGDDNLHHLTWLDTLVFPRPWQRSRFPFFVLAVQCPKDNPEWVYWPGSSGGSAGGAPRADDMVNVVAAILEETLRTRVIDAQRVSLAGLSSGGNGCWELALRRPEMFSAVAPLASPGGDVSRIDRLVSVPVWAFHSTRDEWMPPRFVRRTVRALAQAGGRVHLTEFDSVSHDCWTPAFEQYDLRNWLLAQRRGAAPLWYGPGHIALAGHAANVLRHWTWWQLLLETAVVAALALAVWRGIHILRHKRV